MLFVFLFCSSALSSASFLSRSGVASFHDLLQGSQAVVEPDGKVQRILAALIPYLVKILFDPAELVEQGFVGGIDRAGGGDPFFEPPDRDDRLVGFIGRVANCHREHELLLYVDCSDVFQPRIQPDLKGFGEDLVTRGKPHLVMAGRRQRAVKWAGAPQHDPFKEGGRRVTAIPGECINAFFDGRGLLPFIVAILLCLLYLG